MATRDFTALDKSVADFKAAALDVDAKHEAQETARVKLDQVTADASQAIKDATGESNDATDAAKQAVGLVDTSRKAVDAAMNLSVSDGEASADAAGDKQPGVDAAAAGAAK